MFRLHIQAAEFLFWIRFVVRCSIAGFKPYDRDSSIAIMSRFGIYPLFYLSFSSFCLKNALRESMRYLTYLVKNQVIIAIAYLDRFKVTIVYLSCIVNGDIKQ